MPSNEKSTFMKFLHNLFYKREKLSYFLFSIVFLCFLIAIVNFTTTYLHCRRDMMRIENSYWAKVKGNSEVIDTINRVVLDTIITKVVMQDTVTIKIVVQDTVKNDCCCHCTHSSSQDGYWRLETLEDIHKTFDNNLLTFLISFVLVALLSLVLDERGKTEKIFKQKMDDLEQVQQSVSGQMERIKASLHEIADDTVGNHRKMWNFVHRISLFYYESKTLIFNIESSRYVLNETLHAAVESFHIKVDDFNQEIPPYSDQLKEEAVFSTDDIDRIVAPLLDANNSFDDLYRLAKRYESKLKKKNPNLIHDLMTQTAPLLNSINSLIEKIEGYRAAPKNQQKS